MYFFPYAGIAVYPFFFTAAMICSSLSLDSSYSITISKR